jgi:hypothetical protein
MPNSNVVETLALRLWRRIGEHYASIDVATDRCVCDACQRDRALLTTLPMPPKRLLRARWARRI